MKNATVLVVDDEPATLAAMSKILAPHYTVRAANSGARALQIAGTEPRPDLILLDVMMPGMDGYMVLSRLLETPSTNDIPVIFVTAMEAAEDEERGLELGAVDYIAKPFKPTVVLARTRTHLILKQARDFLLDKNEYLEAEIARRMEENQIVQNVSIRALAHLAETRDPETGEHILRTQAYVQTLAEQLKGHPRFGGIMSDHFIDLLTRSAPLHDIGKVGIPDQILLKPGKLSAEEWRIMQTHAAIGAKAIEQAEKDVEQPVEFLTLAKEIARSHHERWDGAGYPDALSGESIPVSARLMAIADVFDALISKRVYKPAISFAGAREIIVAQRGLQFDPDIVDAFVEKFDAFVAIAERYRDNQ
ncbi:MAG: two-component system response regulator [Chromatiaceae bacterium]|nr:two-component system response regulator [Chromatiaceae bacterium]MCP5443904.1 two-component system response regulator [Chromatiaceae bacterium]